LYEPMTVKLGDEGEQGFTLHVEPGDLMAGEVVGIIGENGCGKSTLMSHLTEHCAVSYKPQHTAPMRSFEGTVSDLLEQSIGGMLGDRLFGLLVLKPLQMAITICLGTPAAAYLLDEPSAGLDCEQRLVVTRVLQRWVTMHLGRAAMVIEHDLLMSASLFSRVIVCTGTPGTACTAHAPEGLAQGLNRFLEGLGVTVREDPTTGRPRLNKKHSSKDREQKKAGRHYLTRADSM